MNDEKKEKQRAERELFELTRPFAVESPLRSWWTVASTWFLLIGTLVAASRVSFWPLRTAFSVIGGLLFVRAFILYHDFLHGAILRKSRFLKFGFYLYGLIVVTPPKSWRHSHNFHHANVGKPIPVSAGKFSLLTSDVGAVPLMTTEMWRQASWTKRLMYRVSRHPLTILAAYLTVFLYSICLYPLVREPRKYWDGAAALIAHASVIVLLWIFGGWDVMLFSFVLPFSIASCCGAYLFFAQHNFEGMQVVNAGEWTYVRASVESSSFMQLNPIMNWFTGNVGYHHVHHVNSHIPFYRLPEAMKAIPQLQTPHVTTLRLRDVWVCLRLSLWDTELNRLVTYRGAYSKSV